MFSLIISFIAVLVSILGLFFTCSNILKSDLRARLSLYWEVDKKNRKIVYKDITAKVGNNPPCKVQLPQLSVFAKSGSIQRVYLLFPYPTKEVNCQYERFEAVHMSPLKLGNTQPWWPKKSPSVQIGLTSFHALCPEENGGSTYLMCLILGTDGSYHLIMLVYKNLLSGKATLDIFDRVDCLTFPEVNNGTYITQFHKCISYLETNGIKVI